jgi:hypothetical protein
LDIANRDILGDQLQTISVALRLFIISSLAIPTFEEQAMWTILCVTVRKGSELLGEGLCVPVQSVLYGSCGLYIFFAYFYVSSQRNYWFRAVATSQILVHTAFDEDLEGKEAENTEGGSAAYFSAEAWQGVREKSEREQEAMIRRMVVERQANNRCYPWIHIDCKLGEGSHGAVYLVKSRVTQKLYAMKVFRLEGGNARTRSLAAEREGMLMRMCNHQNIVSACCAVRVEECALQGQEQLADPRDVTQVSFVDDVQLRGVTHLVMEWCTKGSVQSWLDEHGTLDALAVQWATAHILRGLAYLHAAEMSHGDLKLSNCLVTAAREDGGLLLKLSDLSHATWKARGVRRRVVGTVSYLPPEVGNPSASRRRMDIWALGVSVVEMLTGTPSVTAFPTVGQAPVLAQLLRMTDDPVLPASIAGEAFLDFLQRCLRFEPAERSTALELALHRLVVGMDECPTQSPTIRRVLEVGAALGGGEWRA